MIASTDLVARQQLFPDQLPYVKHTKFDGIKHDCQEFNNTSVS